MYAAISSRLLLLFALLMILQGCKKDPTDPQPDQGETITASVRGRVLDADGNPVIKAKIYTADGSVGSETDVNGIFYLQQAKLPVGGGAVMVEKEGFFTSACAVSPTAGITAYTQVTLIPRGVTGKLQASSGGNIAVNGATIKLPADAYINAASGAAYQGEIRVMAAYLSPESKRLRPGSLSGWTADNTLKTLRPYGMMAVELEGSRGEKLALAGGKNAELTYPVSLSQLSGAPSSISLWYFDPKKGSWKEEGKAGLQGSFYKGTVSHFSFWSIDVPGNGVELSVQFRSTAGVPAAFQQLRISEETNDSSYQYVYTDSLGALKVLVPEQKSLVIYMVNKCNEIMYNGKIAALSANKDLGVLTVNGTVNVQATIKGVVQGCDGKPLQNGYAEVIISGNAYRGVPDAAGNFSIAVNVCAVSDGKAYVNGVDLAGKQQGLQPQMINVSPGGTYTAGTITACGSSTEEYVRIVVDGVPVEFKAPNEPIIAGRDRRPVIGSNDTLTYIQAQNADFSKVLVFYFAGLANPAGNHLNFDFDLNITKDHFVGSGYQGFNVIISQYGIPGQYIAGSFSTVMDDDLYKKRVPVTGEFRVRRGN